MEGYKTLAESTERTPEQEVDMTKQWQSMIRSQAALVDDTSKLQELQPAYDQYFADQEKSRFDAVEELRLNPALEGIVDRLHELDAQQKEQLVLVRDSEDPDEIKKKRAEEITAATQKTKKELIDGEFAKSKEVEDTLNSVAQALREKEAAMEKRKTDIALGATATFLTLGAALPIAQEALGRKEDIESDAQKKIDEILANVPEEKREQYTREAELINQLVSGDSKAAIVNNELRISPTILFEDDAIKEAINTSGATDIQKKALRQAVPQMQKNLAKQEIPIFNELSEFRDFVEENELQNSSDVQKIKAYKDFDGNWFGKLGAQAKLGIVRGYANLIGQTQTVFGTAADLVARGTGSESARAVSDAFMGAAMDQGDEVEQLTRMSQAVGGPQIVSEITQVGTEMVPILATGGLVGLGAKAGIGLGVRAITPKIAANAGFATTVGTAGLQSYAGVYSDATRTLKARFMEEGMGEDEAMDLAMRQAYLPSVVAGIITAGLTALGGKTGEAAIFNLIKNEGFKGTTRTFLKDVAKNTGMEVGEEGLDELFQGIVQQATYNPDMSFGQIVEGALKGGALGGLFGGSIGAATYGIETIQARNAIARREPVSEFNKMRINALEGELKNIQTDSPLGGEEGAFDVYSPSERGLQFGAKPVDQAKIEEINTRRAQLEKMLGDDKLSSITRNDVESELAQSDYEYVKLLAQGRNNLLTEQVLEKIKTLPTETSETMSGLLKIANNMGAETLTGRERVALGITKSGTRFVAATEAPLIKAEADGTFSVTDAGKRAVEAENLIPLSRMIGISEGMRAQLEQQEKAEEALREEAAKREARRTAESDDAKKYGPESAEALKQQVEGTPDKPEGESGKTQLAELLRQEEEQKRKAVEALQKKETPPEPPTEAPPTEGGVAAVTPPAAGEVTPPTEPTEPEARPAIDATTLNPRGKQAVKVLTSIGVDEDTAAYVASRYQDEAGEMGAEEWRDFVLKNFQDNGGVIPAATRYSEDQRYYELAFGIGPEEAAQLVENAKYQNQQAAQKELEQNKQWRRKDERTTETERGVVAPTPAPEGAVVPEGGVPPSPTIEGRRVPLAAPEAPPVAGAVTEEQANQVVKDAQEARAKGKPVDVKGSTQYGPRSIEPKQVIGKTAREALLAVSRLNLSKIAQSDPNEIMMQDVAAILAELNMPILDAEQVVTLSSIRRRGRARRRAGVGIAMPTTFNTPVELFVHEAGHTLTADEIAKYAPRNITGRGKAYLEAINKAIADANTPDPVKRLFTLYVSTMDQLGITEQYFGDKGIAGTPDADLSRAMARRLQAKGDLRKDLNWTQLYGLANIEEFVSQTFSEPDFRDLLKTLKDPTQPSRTMWSAFVEAIQRILQLPKESMAAGVIEASVDIGMITTPSRAQGRAAPTPAPRGEYPPIGININDAAQNFTEQILSGEKTIETRATDSLRPYVGRRVGIVRTGVGPAELVGYATIGEPVVYNSTEEFRADQEKHLVEAGSEFDIQEGGVKYGYPLTDVESVTPTPVTSQGIVARKIPQPEVTEGDMAPMGEPEEGKTVEMSLEMEKERTFQLLGERLYTAELPKVVVKETTQNAFDAIKDAEETGEIPKGSGVIGYSRKELEVNGQKIVRMMFTDNGGGMTPEILQNAFFTVGGTFKRSGKGSGGFGLAKLGMFMSADRVMVETVRDGVVTKADLTKQELVDKKFNVNVAEDPSRQNGTMVILEFKKSITRSDGKTVEFENPYTVFDRLIHHDLTIIDDNYGSYQNELIGLFQNESSGLWTLDKIKKSQGKKPYTFEDFVKDAPNVETFEQDFVIAGAKKPIKVRVASSRLGLKRKDGKAKWNEDVQIAGATRNLKNHNMSVYSNGLFQFEKENLKIDPLKLWGGDPLPYNIVVDIDAGGLDAASLAYPFTNSREDFQNGVVKDYINQLLNDIRIKERQRQFDQEFNLLTDISGGKPRKDSPTLYNNTTIVPEPFEQKFLEDLSKTVFDVADDLVVALRKGTEDNILEDTWYKVKSQKGSVAPTGKSEEDSLDYFYGVGISKNWGGVNTSRDPVSVLVNPIYEERVDEYARTEFGRRMLARTIAKTLIHEINHHLHRNEGSDFTFFILQNEAYLGEVGAIQSAVDKILPIVNQHPDAIISLKNKFRTAETKDTDNELTGEQYERSSKEPDGQPRTTIVGGDRLVQQPSTEVSARPTSEEDGEQTGAYLPSSITAGGRQDAGVGEGIYFGEALSSSLVENRAQINEDGISRAEGAEPAPEEEFEIIPEQVEDQIEGTPEASTIKVMGEAFDMANEQSAAEGTPEGTLPLQTITNAWMNSERDVDTLENAIIRYTNLSPEVAETLAQAISKQLEIQRGIAEVSSMASKRAEEEIEERPYSFAARVKRELPDSVRRKIDTIYEVLRNDVSVQEANEVMRGLSIEEAVAATQDMENGVSFPVRSMMAQIVNRRMIDYRKNAKNKGRNEDYKAAVDAHVDFFNWTNEYFKELGQGVQAIARFMDLGVDGQLRKIKKDIDRVISKNIKERKGKIDKIKKDVEDGDAAAFNAAVKANKGNIEKAANKAAQQEAKKITIEEQAQKLAQRAAQKVAGEVVRPRKVDPLSELVNGHLRKYNKDFLAEARALGVSPETAQKIEESAQKLRDSRVAAKTEKERFQAMQDERMRVKRQLARENKYIYGERPTIWENYQSIFSERLARRMMRDPKKKVPPSLLLFTDRLTENLLGFLPEAERQASTPKSFQAMVEDALNNKERYQEAFDKAVRDISAKVEELEATASETEEGNEAYFQALAAQEFLQNLAPQIQDFPVSDKLISRFVNQKAKQLEIPIISEYNRWYRASKRERGEIEAKIQGRLVADLNTPLEDARKLSASIIKDFREKAEARRIKALERFKNPTEKTTTEKQTQLQKFFELTNMGALTDQDAYEIMANRFNLPTWDQDFAERIREMAEAIQDMDDGLQRRLMTQNLMVEIARQKGFNLADLGASFIYANILSSPDTHMVNIVDTLLNNFSNAFADFIATKDPSRLRGVVSGYRKGIFEAMEIMKTGRRINMPHFEEKAPLTAELVRFGYKGGVKMGSLEGANSIAQSILESKPARFLNAAKWVGRLLEAQDAMNFAASVEGQRYADASRIATEEGVSGRAKQKRIHEILNVGDAAYQKALQQAQAEGYTGSEAKFRAIEIQDEKIPADIKEQSFERGLRDVYRNMPVGVAGAMASTVNSAIMKISNPWVRNAAKLTVSPFIITPVNLFNKWLDWSPWGYKRLFRGTGGWYGPDSKYYVAPYAKGTPEWRAQLFKANSSVVVMGLLGGLIKAGIMTLTGRGPSDEEERKQWIADGNKPYTFRFGDGPQISFVYSPWAVPLSVMANMVNWDKYNAKDDASYAYRIIASMTFVPAIVMELPFFQGAADIIDLANMKSNADLGKRFEKFAEGKMGMLFPNFLRYIDRLFDPQQYDSQGVKGLIIDQMPFARRLGGPKLNMFGEPIAEGKPLIDRLAGRFVAFPKPSRESRILAKYDAYPYMPNPRRAEALIDGEKAPMTEEQYGEFAVGVGQEFKKWLNSNYNPDAEVSEKDLERGKKRISKRLSEIRARWVRKVSTY
jgi:hypothetical protein